VTCRTNPTLRGLPQDGEEDQASSTRLRRNEPVEHSSQTGMMLRHRPGHVPRSGSGGRFASDHAHVRFLRPRGVAAGNAILLAGGAVGDFSTMTFEQRLQVAIAVRDAAGSGSAVSGLFRADMGGVRVLAAGRHVAGAGSGAGDGGGVRGCASRCLIRRSKEHLPQILLARASHGGGLGGAGARGGASLRRNGPLRIGRGLEHRQSSDRPADKRCLGKWDARHMLPAETA